MLTRTQFESACQAFAATHKSDAPYSKALREWKWIETYPYGYLARTQIYARPFTDIHLSDDLELELDAATAVAPTPGLENVISQQFIVFSASFQVPAFYFTAHNTNGTPLSLAQMVESSLFKFQVPTGSEANGYALTLPDAPLPLLSQGEHPTLGTPCWYLHPCESSNAVDELFQEVGQTSWTEESRLVRWMELWIMTVSGVLNL